VLLLVIIIILCVFLFRRVIVFLSNRTMVVIRGKWVNQGFFRDFEIYLNIWNFLFLFIVLVITTRVLIFAFSYIRSLRVHNFIILYILFVIRIFWLICVNNFYWIIFGWDGLGVVSFLLIVYYINYESISNGLFTIFQNRIGDLFFVLFLVGNLSLRIGNRVWVNFGLTFLIVGACVKRAQFPFNSWLLAAIRAPTPISSLVHSSTLVVAGVYVLLQFSYCLRGGLVVLKFLRLLTLFYRRVGLLGEFDMKKLIAYSTMSHVGLIIYLLRFQLFKVVYFHLNVHAMFKSLMFICFGFVMLVSYHRQDKRLVRFIHLNPFVKMIYYLSSICLAGLPFLRSFFF
jgi:NADH-ubiquinone oxidoreductase chain 5